MWAKTNQSLYTVTTPASTTPITLTEAKAYLRVTNTAEDTLITALISAATSLVEKYTGRTLVDTTFRAQFSNLIVSKSESWPLLEIMRSPLDSISAFEELVDGSWAAVDSDSYALRDMQGYSRLLVNPAYSGVSSADEIEPYIYRVDFVAGYGAAAAVPEALNTAIMSAVNFFYTNRGDCGDCGASNNAGTLPPEAKMLANPYRIKRVF